jgi:hypothetical protein
MKLGTSQPHERLDAGRGFAYTCPCIRDQRHSIGKEVRQMAAQKVNMTGASATAHLPEEER